MLAATSREFHPGPCLWVRRAILLRVFNAGVSLCRLVCRRPQAAKPVLRRGSSRSAFPLWGKAVMAYPPTGSVQTECTRLPVMLRTKGRFLCQRTIGFVGLQKHINSGYAFAERQIAHNGEAWERGTRSPQAGEKVILHEKQECGVIRRTCSLLRISSST